MTREQIISEIAKLNSFDRDYIWQWLEINIENGEASVLSVLPDLHERFGWVNHSCNNNDYYEFS
jgi:hypothetical protein